MARGRSTDNYKQDTCKPDHPTHHCSVGQMCLQQATTATEWDVQSAQHTHCRMKCSGQYLHNDRKHLHWGTDLRPVLQRPPATVGRPGSSCAHAWREEQNPATSCRAAERTTGSRLDHKGGNHAKYGCPAARVSAPSEHSHTDCQPCNRKHSPGLCHMRSASAHKEDAVFRFMQKTTNSIGMTKCICSAYSPRAPRTCEFVVPTSLTHPREIALAVLETTYQQPTWPPQCSNFLPLRLGKR
jgi:hypothetical protein